jgi:uncharacterized protein
LSPTGLARHAVAAARARGIIALSEQVFGEIAEVLARPKFSQALTDDRRHEILEMLTAAAMWVEPTDRVADCRDAKDNRYLELALASGAAAILSGDDDLLVLDPWRGVRVLRPQAFLEQVERGANQSQT